MEGTTNVDSTSPTKNQVMPNFALGFVNYSELLDSKLEMPHDSEGSGEGLLNAF